MKIAAIEDLNALCVSYPRVLGSEVMWLLEKPLGFFENVLLKVSFFTEEGFSVDVILVVRQGEATFIFFIKARLSHNFDKCVLKLCTLI